MKVLKSFELELAELSPGSGVLTIKVGGVDVESATVSYFGDMFFSSLGSTTKTLIETAESLPEVA